MSQEKLSQKLGLNTSKKLIEKLRRDTIGIDAKYTLATGEIQKRIYLDSTATTLQLGIVKDVMDKYLPYYGNIHTSVHFNAKLSTHEFDWAHDMVLNFVEADSETYGCFFVGSGTTGGINRIARTLRRKRPERDIVITSIMEHHSNDLPHRKHFNKVIHVPVLVTDQGFGSVDLQRIEEALKAYGDRVNYISITGVSNVTGIINPIYDVAELAHRYGILILVDAAQMAAHVPIKMSGHQNPLRNLDMIAMSGHKMYAPSSPGAVVTRLDLFTDVEPEELGGGMVNDVYVERYMSTNNFPDREEAGTPNIAGAIALATVLYTLQNIGMDVIDQIESEMIYYAVNRLTQIKNVIVYGQTDMHVCRRIGSVSININGMHHSLTAAILNDYFNIAVRNACFCAHPYVRAMISDELNKQIDSLPDDYSNQELEELADLHRGMVRISFGIYNTKSDIDTLVSALIKITKNPEFYSKQYHQSNIGNYIHNSFYFDSTAIFSIQKSVDRWLAVSDD